MPEHPAPGVDVSGLRDEVGAGAALWAGRLEAVPGARWAALSPLPVATFNVATCYSPEASDLDWAVSTLLGHGHPGLVQVAGPALGAGRVLVDAGLVPVVAAPLMVLAAADVLPR